MRWLAYGLLCAAAASAQDRLAVDWRKGIGGQSG
jgi:hypothetical protein